MIFLVNRGKEGKEEGDGGEQIPVAAQVGGLIVHFRATVQLLLGAKTLHQAHIVSLQRGLHGPQCAPVMILRDVSLRYWRGES